MRRRLGTGIIGGLLLLAACNPVGDGRPTDEEFAAEVQARCAAVAKQIEGLGPLPVDSPTATATFVDTTVRAQRRLVKDLQGLAPPMGRDARIADWLGEVEAAIEAEAKVATALRGGDAAAISAAIRAAQDAAATANRTAGRLGFPRCARPGPTGAAASTTSTAATTATSPASASTAPGTAR